MRNPCDEKKERKKNSTVADFIVCFEFIFFVIGISINFALLRALIVLKQMDFGAFTSKRHVKSSSSCLTGGRWEE